MANVSIEINGHKYNMGCEDGQEEHLIRLGRYFDNHVKNLAKGVGQIGDQRLFLMAALLIADENYEMRQKSDALQAELMRIKDTRTGEDDSANARQAAKDIEFRAVETIDEVTKIFHAAADRLDELSGELNKA